MERNINWYSPSLGRNMEMLVFGHGGKPIILFPTSMGRHFQNKDFGLIGAAQWFVDNGLVTIYCPDSVDEESWYNKGIHPADKVRRHMQYNAYILHELIPFIHGERGQQRIATAGCSFGAYHATNFALRYPALVSHVFNMGGAFNIAMHTDGYFDDNLFFHNPPSYLRDATDPALWNLSIVLGAGEHDFCLHHNQELSAILHGKGINHWLDVRQGGNHDWPIWRDMFPHYISEMLK